MTEYNNNSAGAKQYILDQIGRFSNYRGKDLSVLLMFDFEITGSINALRSIGLIDAFDFNELSQKLMLASRNAANDVINDSFDRV